MIILVHFVVGIIILGTIFPPIEALACAFAVACLISAVRSIVREPK